MMNANVESTVAEQAVATPRQALTYQRRARQCLKTTATTATSTGTTSGARFVPLLGGQSAAA